MLDTLSRKGNKKNNNESRLPLFVLINNVEMFLRLVMQIKCEPL